MRGKLSDNGGELTIELFVRFEYLSQTDEGAHDGDVDIDGLIAVQHAREHRDTLLRKCSRQIAPPTVFRT